MKREYKIDMSKKIEKLKEKQKIKKQQNRIKLLIEQIKNYDFFYKFGLESNKPTWLKYLNKAKKELEDLLK